MQDGTLSVAALCALVVRRSSPARVPPRRATGRTTRSLVKLAMGRGEVIDLMERGLNCTAQRAASAAMGCKAAKWHWKSVGYSRGAEKKPVRVL